MVAGLLALVLGACGGLPTAGPVRPGRAVDEPQVEPIRIVPQGPVDGASKTQIAVGFIRAGAGFQETADGPNVAQEFLVDSSAKAWRPTSTVTVVGYDLTATELTSGAIRVSASAVATVTAQGRYVELAPGSTVTATLAMSQVGGQWRAVLPEGFGLWLTPPDFERLFQPVRLAYVASDRLATLADVRWFAKGSGLATSIARAEIAAVPTYLTGAVRAGFPDGSALAVDAVAVDQGIATIQLNEVALRTDQTQRSVMYAQLVTGLLQAPNVNGVSIVVGRTPLELGGVDLPVRSMDQLGLSVGHPTPAPFALVRSGTVLRRLAPLDIAELDTRPNLRPSPSQSATAALPSVATGWVWLAAAPDGSEIAAVGGDRKQLRRWRGEQALDVAGVGFGLVRPAYDDRGYLWVAGSDAARGTTVWVLDRAVDDTRAQAISSGWLTGRSILSLRVSPDGTRVAVVSRGADGDRLDIAGVVRDPRGRPVALAQPWRQADPLVTVRDVTWVDSDTLAVLGRTRATDPMRPYLAPIGQGIGLRDPGASLMTPVPGARSITSVGGVRRLVIGSDDGVVRARAGNSWLTLPGVTEVVQPGA
ncbi:MAG: LpqB family beta-propeller domain-containing protein [Candidatus Lutibacillus vidarii]|nr:GerMN domain-containing protein [Candidatus Lutibacillus vidarii]HON74826.1 LpqB family beta-propeller domain-containing protein [Dermatophilaceae bacterium]